MDDKELKIGATACVAWIAWAVAVGLVAIGWAVGERALGQFGIVACGAAATIHVRSFLCRLAYMLTSAYQLGRRDEARAQGGRVSTIPAPRTNGSPRDSHLPN